MWPKHKIKKRNFLGKILQMQNKKIVLITGASSGLGHHAALTLIKEGHTVYGAARRADKMQDLVQAGGHAVAMDVTDEGQIVLTKN